MTDFSLKEFALFDKQESPDKITRVNHHRSGKIIGLFLKGPIPLNWISKSASLPGKTLHVGIALWFLSGLNRSLTVRLSGIILRLLGVHRHSSYRALIHLEKAGLVSVVRHSGRNPIVTLLYTSFDNELITPNEGTAIPKSEL
jgi:hypothetical protein